MEQKKSTGKRKADSLRPKPPEPKTPEPKSPNYEKLSLIILIIGTIGTYLTVIVTYISGTIHLRGFLTVFGTSAFLFGLIPWNLFFYKLIKKNKPIGKGIKITRIIFTITGGLFLLSSIPMYIYNYNPAFRPPTPTSIPSNTPTPRFTVTPSDTPTPTFTVTPSNTPTSTPTITPSETPTPINCIPHPDWSFWNPSVTIKTYKIGDVNCMLLDEYGLYGKLQLSSKSLSELRLYSESSDRITNGIYYRLQRVPQTIEMSLTINELLIPNSCVSNQNENTYCDSNLIIGFGDPTGSSGYFIIFRYAGDYSQRWVCMLESIYSPCVESARFKIDNSNNHFTIKLQIDPPDINFTVNDITLHATKQIPDKILWIGYNIRSKGTIDGSIEIK